MIGSRFILVAFMAYAMVFSVATRADVVRDDGHPMSAAEAQMLQQMARDSKASFAKTFASSQALTAAEEKEAELRKKVEDGDVSVPDNNVGAKEVLGKTGQNAAK